MNKLTFAIAASVLAIGGTAALAAQDAGRPDRNAPMARADVATRAAAMFARMDVNKDGKLDQADRTARHAERFARLDTDSNGAISRDEFAAAGDRRAEMRGPGGPNGERGERRGRMGGQHGRGGHGGHDMKGMMAKQADTNNDGAITQAELSAAMLKHFDATDANKDGQVTPDERRAARAAMRGK